MPQIAMWTIEKPELSIAKGIDIDNLIANCKKLDESDRPLLMQLYQEYDDQHGHVTDTQIRVISEEKAKAIHDTYDKTQINKPLAYIRDDLVANVFKCPYCSLGQPETLDHYMPRGKFNALAVCRMNLVPMCARCNNLKGDKEYANFVHCYYDKFPTNKPFLVANVYTQEFRFVVAFAFDSEAIGDSTLERRLVYQEDKINLFKRLEKESQVFITTICCSCDQDDTVTLKLWLKRILEKNILIYGENDWRCAILRGMLAYPDLDISQIKYNKNNPTRVNFGGA